MTSTQNPTTITAPPGTPFLDVEREFDAAAELVFRAHAEPELVVQWLGPRDLKMRIDTWDVRSGGSYRYLHYRDGQDLAAWFHGVFHTVVPNELVIQTFEFEGAPNEVCIETTRFVDLGGRTRLSTHSVFPSLEAREAALQSGMTYGIEQSMDRLAELVAGNR
jgi:uncharacterized protein YndB with AHSA1/START domain